MEKKMIDIMGRADEEFFFGAELSEEETLSLTQSLDFEKIKEHARRGIGESTDGAARKTIYVQPSKIMKRAVCVLIAVMLLGGTVAVAQHLGAFQRFFGIQAVVPEDAVTDVGKSVVKDGVRMTVDSVIAGENDFVTLFSFEREDGEPFPENANICNVGLNTDKGGFNVATYSARLSEDRKKMMTCIESSSGEPMLGKTVTGKAEGLYTENVQEENLETSLYECFQKDPVRMKFNESTEVNGDSSWIPLDSDLEEQLVKQQKDYPVTMPLSKEYPDYCFAGIGTIDGRIFIATSIPDYFENGLKSANRTEAVVNKLIDSRTGETYSGSYGSIPSTKDKSKGLIIAEYPGLDEEDLPYLKPVVTYNLRTMIAEGPWEISFNVEDQGQNITVDPDMKVNTKSGEVILTKASISQVGGYVIGEWSDQSIFGLPESYGTKFRAVTEDGEVLKFRISGGSSFRDQQGKNCFKFNYELYQDEKERNRIFLSRDKLKSIRTIVLDDKEISIH